MKKTCQEIKAPQYPGKKGEGMEEEKENKYYNSGLRKPNTTHSEEKKVQELGKSFSPPLTPEMKLKPVGFWSKKLQDLEENKMKNKKHRPYEFSGTDESESSYKIRKKHRQKPRLKKRQYVVSQYNKAVAKANKVHEPKKEVKLPHKLALGSGQVMLTKEKKEPAETKTAEAKKFTFSTAVQSFGITSTPAINKNNFVGASDFLFLSPIIKKEDHYCNSYTEHLPAEPKAVDGSPLTSYPNKETLKVETKLKLFSCRRVLRSGKMLEI